MKREITLLIFAVLLLGILRTFAQNEIKPIKIGEKLPDAVLKEMVNYRSPSAKLSDFKGKALIIDVWATWCGACLDAFPKIDSLQKNYKDKLNFLLVTSQPKKDIEAFFRKKMWQSYMLPSVVNDNLLRKYFPHAGLPHQIWVDKNGTVRSINNGQYMSSGWLTKLLSDEKLNIREKSSVGDLKITSGADPLVIYDYQKNGLENMLSYGYVSMFQMDVQARGETKIEKEKGVIRLSYKNMDWLHLLWRAVIGRSDYTNPFHRRTMIIRKDTKNFGPLGDLEYQNVFCYDGIVKDTSEVRAREFMHGQLDAAFKTKSYVEIRKMRVYVLREYGENHRYRIADTVRFKNNADRKIRNWKGLLRYFVPDVNGSLKLKYPVIDEVPYTGITYFQFDLSIDDPEKLSEKLREYGLEIVESERDLKVLIVEDRK